MINNKTIYIIGDSTVEDGNDPFYGWGGQLARYIPGGYSVVNAAKSGRSSKSFRDEGLFDPVRQAMCEGDILLIQFGHNDEKDDAERHTDPDSTFPESLANYVAAARSAGVLPVLITSVSRNYFTGDGSLMYTHGEYPRAVRDLAKKLGVPLIDLEQETRRLLLDLGPSESESLFVNLEAGEHPVFPDGWHDKTHFNLAGARKVSEIVAEGLRKLSIV